MVVLHAGYAAPIRWAEILGASGTRRTGCDVFGSDVPTVDEAGCLGCWQAIWALDVPIGASPDSAEAQRGIAGERDGLRPAAHADLAEDGGDMIAD